MVEMGRELSGDSCILHTRKENLWKDALPRPSTVLSRSPGRALAFF